jgi:ubiquinone/menaquinone biosynthesis C-methylase UbiE
MKLKKSKKIVNNNARLKIYNSYRDQIVKKYTKSYLKYHYSPKTLGWDKGRQDIRFEILLSFFECKGKRILDIGCGFGDLNRVITKKYGSTYQYIGIDIVDSLVEEGRFRYPQKNIKFINADFLDYSFKSDFDIVVASGLFNLKFEKSKNDLFVKKVLKKAWKICKEGIAFDFLSDKVDYKLKHTYHNNPEQILKTAYELSRNVVLRNDYIPFEFCLFVGKDDSFSKNEVILNTYKNKKII